MLSRLNELFKGWISIAIISVVSLTFVLWGVESYMHNGARSEAVAKVAKVEISKDNLNRMFERTRMQYEQLSGNAIVDENQIRTLRAQTLESLISNQAMQQDAARVGIYVSPQQAESHMFAIPAFQEEGKFSSERFEQTLRALQYTQGEFIKDLQNDMSVNQLRAGIVMSAFATPQYVENMIRLVEQKRDIHYLELDASQFKTAVTPAAIKAYYDKNQAEFKTPEQVKIAYLTLSLEDLVKNTQVSDEELNQFYQSNISSYMTPAKWRIAHINVKLPENPTPEQIKSAKERADNIVKKIQSGKDFSEIAKTESDDAVTKNQGGEMPELTKGMMDASFEAAFTPLTKVGEVSAPTQTKYGFEIVKLIAYTPESTTPLATLKDKLAQNIKQEKAQKQFGDFREELANQTFSNPTTLDVASKSLKLPIVTSDYFSKQTPGEGITKNGQVIRAAFSDDVMTQGNNSDVIAINDNTMVVLRVVEHKPATVQPLAQVTKAIEEKLSLEGGFAASNEFAKKLMDAKTTPEQAQAMLASHHLQWKSEIGLMRKNTALASPILEAAFSLSKKSANDVPFKIINNSNKGMAIVKLNSVIPGVITGLTSQQHNALRDEFANSNGVLVYEVYKDDVMKNTKVERMEVATTASD